MSEVALGQPPTPPPYAVSMVQLAFTGAESSRQAKKSFFAFWSDQKTPIPVSYTHLTLPTTPYV